MFTIEKWHKLAITLDEIYALDKHRPLGISGHMRVRNDAHTLRLSVESILPALDELVITVQPSTDGTVSICEDLALRHDKIRLYYYDEDIFTARQSHVKPSRSILSNPISRDERSVYNLAHYYNYGLVRIRYKYYMKVDADQLHFTDKFIALRDAILRADVYTKKKKKHTHRLLEGAANILQHPRLRNITSRSLDIYSLIRLFRILYGDAWFSLGGLNLLSSNSDLIDLNKDSMMRQYVPLNCGPYMHNGSELIICVPRSDNIYRYSMGRPYEVFYRRGYNLNVGILGVFWLHYGFLKRGLFAEDQARYVSLAGYLGMHPSELVRCSSRYLAFSTHALCHLHGWLYRDREYILRFLDGL